MAIVFSDPAVAETRVADLIDAEQFGEMAGVKRMTIHAYKKKPERYGLPEPALWAAGVPLWTRQQAEGWLKDRPRGRWPEKAT